MDGIELAQFKDDTLKYLITIDGDYLTEYVYSKMGNPTKTQDHFDEIITQMKREAGRYFAYSKDSGMIYIGSNNFTKEFLDKGGFVNMYESELEAELQAASLAEQDRRIKDLEERKLKNYWWPIIISAISAVVALGSSAFAIHSNSNSVSRSELKTIQKNIKTLETDFKKENDELKSRIYEAEMLIAVYESDSIP